MMLGYLTISTNDGCYKCFIEGNLIFHCTSASCINSAIETNALMTGERKQLSLIDL